MIFARVKDFKFHKFAKIQIFTKSPNFVIKKNSYYHKNFAGSRFLGKVYLGVRAPAKSHAVQKCTSIHTRGTRLWMRFYPQFQNRGLCSKADCNDGSNFHCFLNHISSGLFNSKCSNVGPNFWSLQIQNFEFSNFQFSSAMRNFGVGISPGPLHQLDLNKIGLETMICVQIVQENRRISGSWRHNGRFGGILWRRSKK